jgi:hypothetical protein
VRYFPNRPSRIAIGLAALLLSVSAHATLVAVVPARDGLAIAADSRFTFMGASCDGAFKIIEPARPLRTVAFVTGDSIFVAPPPVGENPCRYLATAPRLLDMGAVVKAYLDRSEDNAARISTAGLAAECVRDLQHFERTYPRALGGYAGREIVSVVVVSYDPVRHVSTLRNFVVRLDPGNDAGGQRVEAVRMSVTTVGPKSLRGVWIYGEAGYVNHSVYDGPGQRFLAPATQNFLRVHEAIGAVTAMEAVAAAEDVVKAASRMAEIDPPASGIGGMVRVVVLNSEPHGDALTHATAH